MTTWPIYSQGQRGLPSFGEPMYSQMSNQAIGNSAKNTFETSPSIAPMSPVEMASQRLFNSLDELNSRIQHLIERLQPVLIDFPNKGCDTTSSPTECSCQVANSFNDAESRVRIACVQIAATLDRLGC